MIEVPSKRLMVMPRRAEPLPRADRLKLGIAKVPAQLAVNARGVVPSRPGIGVGRQDSDLMATRPEVIDRRLPDQLVATEMVRGIHVAHRQDPHRSRIESPGVSDQIEVSVVVASHARSLRLLWLLNALEGQTIERGSWEVVVVHDYDSVTVKRVLDTHPLRAAGMLSHISIAAGTGSPARQRNLGWRASRGPLVAFTDDDCRPEGDWLEHLVAAAHRAPGTVVQGATRPDPCEIAILAAPHVRTLHIEPVGPFAQTCNILYPRTLLDRLGGFDERAITGEDVDLSLRARAAGAEIAPAPAAIVNHAIESFPLAGILRRNVKWRHLAYLVSRHPELRRELHLRIFWDADHLLVTVAFLGLLGALRHRPLLVVTIPYVLSACRRRGPGRRARAIALMELPGQGIRQLAEVAGLLVGSLRHRTVVL